MTSDLEQIAEEMRILNAALSLNHFSRKKVGDPLKGHEADLWDLMRSNENWSARIHTWIAANKESEDELKLLSAANISLADGCRNREEEIDFLRSKIAKESPQRKAFVDRARFLAADVTGRGWHLGGNAAEDFMKSYAAMIEAEKVEAERGEVEKNMTLESEGK